MPFGQHRGMSFETIVERERNGLRYLWNVYKGKAEDGPFFEALGEFLKDKPLK